VTELISALGRLPFVVFDFGTLLIDDRFLKTRSVCNHVYGIDGSVPQAVAWFIEAPLDEATLATARGTDPYTQSQIDLMDSGKQEGKISQK
jgi:hypothetical protein